MINLKQELGRVLIVFTLAAFLVGNLTISPLSEGTAGDDLRSMPVYVIMGALCAQFAVLNIAYVFAAIRLWIKTLLILGAGLILYIVFIQGSALTSSLWQFGSWTEVVIPVLLAPVLCLSIQLPLWILRLLSRWRLVSKDSLSQQPAPQSSIGTLMIGILLVGLSLAALRLVPFIEGNELGSFIPAMVVVCAILAGVSLVSALPMTFAVFYPKQLVLSITFLMLYAMVVSCIALGVIFYLASGSTWYWGWEFLGLALLYLSFIGWTLLPMIGARFLGVRLVPYRKESNRIPVTRATEAPSTSAHPLDLDRPTEQATPAPGAE